MIVVLLIKVLICPCAICILVVLDDTFSTKSPTSPDATLRFSTVVDKLLNAKSKVCFLSSKYILVPFKCFSAVIHFREKTCYIKFTT